MGTVIIDFLGNGGVLGSPGTIGAPSVAQFSLEVEAARARVVTAADAARNIPTTLPAPSAVARQAAREAKRRAEQMGVPGSVWEVYTYMTSGNVTGKGMVDLGFGLAEEEIRKQGGLEANLAIQALTSIKNGQVPAGEIATTLAVAGAQKFGVPSSAVTTLASVLGGNATVESVIRDAIEAAVVIGANVGCAAVGIPPGPCGFIAGTIAPVIYDYFRSVYDNFVAYFSNEEEKRKARLRIEQTNLYFKAGRDELRIETDAVYAIAQQYNQVFNLRVPAVFLHRGLVGVRTARTWPDALTDEKLAEDEKTQQEYIAAVQAALVSRGGSPSMWERHNQEADWAQIRKQLKFIPGYSDDPRRYNYPAGLRCYLPEGASSEDRYKCALMMRLSWYEARLQQGVRRIFGLIAREKGLEDVAFKMRKQQLYYSSTSVDLVSRTADPGVVYVPGLLQKKKKSVWPSIVVGALVLGVVGVGGYRVATGHWPRVPNALKFRVPKVKFKKPWFPKFRWPRKRRVS